MLETQLPAWSRSTLTRLMEHRWQGEKPGPLDENGEKQLHTTAWVVDTYMRYDENPVHDKAMGQPGVVDVGRSRLTYERTGEQGVEAVLEGADKDGRPVAVYLEREGQQIEAYSAQQWDSGLYLQGGTTAQDGFYLSHFQEH